MLETSYPHTNRPDTVTISPEEYCDLIRSQAQLDTLLVLMTNTGSVPTCLIRAYAKERSIAKEADNGNGQAVLLDEAERKLHDQRHD